MAAWKIPFKALAKKVFMLLPFALQVRLVRGNPEAAFYIDSRAKTVQIDYFLSEFRMEIDVDVDLQRRMLSGSYETETMSALPMLVKKNDICLDIGANVGAISFALAQFSGQSGEVHSFEPGPVFAARFRRNLELNPKLKARVHLHEIGLSDHSAVLPWQASDVYTGTASMDPALHSTHLKTHYLNVVPIDECSIIQNLPHIDFIKIDVDGLELSIFKGGLKTLKKHRPKIFFETTLWNEDQKKAAKEIEQILRSIGYELFRMTVSDGLVAVSFPNFGENTIAIPSSS